MPQFDPSQISTPYALGAAIALIVAIVTGRKQQAVARTAKALEKAVESGDKQSVAAILGTIGVPKEKITSKDLGVLANLEIQKLEAQKSTSKIWALSGVVSLAILMLAAVALGSAKPVPCSTETLKSCTNTELESILLKSDEANGLRALSELSTRHSGEPSLLVRSISRSALLNKNIEDDAIKAIINSSTSPEALATAAEELAKGYSTDRFSAKADARYIDFFGLLYQRDKKLFNEVFPAPKGNTPVPNVPLEALRQEILQLNARGKR